MNTASMRAKVLALEAEIMELPQAQLGNFHNFNCGVYQRGGTIPAGTVATGAIHRNKSTFVLAKGTMMLMTEDGPLCVEAPWATVSPPGTKRVMYAVTDCVVIAVIETDLTTPEEVERAVTVSSFDQLESPIGAELLCHSGLQGQD